MMRTIRAAYSHVLLVASFKDGHGSQTTTTHGDIGKLVGGTVGVDSEEMRTGRVDSSEDEMGTDLALVPVDQLKSCERLE
jgi:hypothetical protein